MRVMTHLPRRTVLRSAAGTLVLGTLAGCTGDDDGNGGDGDSDSDGDDGNGDDPETRADTWLSDNNANEYDGSVADHTGEDEVTVMVGAGNGRAFDPPAIRIDTGTTVIWEWTGQGGNHNVVPDGDTDFEDFGQQEQTDEEGHTAESTFDEAGVGLYVCQPHAAQGMYGAVIVE